MNLVIEASTTLSWYFEDERTQESDAVLDQVVTGGAIVPALWRLEVANGLQMAIRRKRIDKAFRDLALQRLGALPIIIDPEGDGHVWGATLQFAERFDLTVYDGAYLELAHRRHLPLVSLDAKLTAAGKAIGLASLGTVDRPPTE